MKKVKIEFEDWDYTCGDGCCYDYGVSVKLNDKPLEHYKGIDYPDNNLGDDPENLIISILTKLGYEVEFKRTK